MKKLAIDGGTPVRIKPFPSHFPGASLIGEEELKELADVVQEKSPFRHYGIGNPQKVNTFEKEVCAFIGCKYALAVSSGTAALSVAIAALGIGPGDEVIIPSMAWFSDYCALINFGILPVFADIGEDLNLDPEDFEKKITKNTKAVIPVSYQGVPAKMDEIMAIANKHNIPVIEDIAQAFGSDYKGKKLGTIGKISISSFQTHKMITCGEGGIVMTDDEQLFERAVRYHDLGTVRPYFQNLIKNKALLSEDRCFAGQQLRMSELQGAFVLAQLRKIETVINNCRHTSKIITKNLVNNNLFTIRHTDGDCGIAFIMLFKEQAFCEYFMKALLAEGLECGPSSACCNLMEKVPIKNKGMVNDSFPPFGKGFNGEKVVYDSLNDCLSTNKIMNRVLAISIGPLFTEEDAQDIYEAINKVVCSVKEKGVN